jgi:Ca2+-binding EF-hand superfamily protein
MGKTLTDEEVDVWITEADADGSGTIDLEVCIMHASV